MHHTQIKKAVKEYAADFAVKGADGIKLQLLEDKFSEEDANAIIKALEGKGDDSEADSEDEKEKETKKPVEKVASPNVAIAAKLAGFDYKENFKGEQFAKYGELVQKLPHEKMFDFDVMKVEAITKVRYKGVKDSPVDIVGVRIIDSKPKMTTRVSPKVALAQNGQIVRDEDGEFFEVVGQQFHQRGNGLFYFLKK